MPQRDASRLMIVQNDLVLDAQFTDLPNYLQAGDLLVLNETRVIAARLRGRRIPGGGNAELLLLHPADQPRYSSRALRWVALVRPARRLPTGTRISFGDDGQATIVRELADGAREIELTIAIPLERFLERVGRMPLPPYIRNESSDSQARYQTVFARVAGSVAAPTASLHFTNELLERLHRRGVERTAIVLDVGLGTFRPIVANRIDDHVMHAETYAIPQVAIDAIDRTRRRGGRIVAAGTTVVRALEGSAAANGTVRAGDARTDLFITPGYSFQVVDALITNFHLPHSSLLVLVSAFSGRQRIRRAYQEAVRRRYRFFSFGDAMLLTRGHDVCPAS